MLEELGEEWTTNKLFRIGASALLGDIERQVYHYVNWFFNFIHFFYVAQALYIEDTIYVELYWYFILIFFAYAHIELIV